MMGFAKAAQRDRPRLRLNFNDSKPDDQVLINGITGNWEFGKSQLPRTRLHGSCDKRGSIRHGKAYGQWKNLSGPKSHKAPRCEAMSMVGER